MSTFNMPNVESFRRVFLPTLVSYLRENGKFSVSGDLKLSCVNSLGDVPVYVGGNKLTFRSVVAGKNGVECASQVNWREVDTAGTLAQVARDYLVSELEREVPEWFNNERKVYKSGRGAVSVDILESLGL